MMKPQLSILRAAMALIVLVSLSLSPVHMRDLNAFAPTNQMDIAHPASEVAGLKQQTSLQKLLPQPWLPILGLILSFAIAVRIVRQSRWRYPAIFLIRRKLLLMPVKFTSVYLGC